MDEDWKKPALKGLGKPVSSEALRWHGVKPEEPWDASQTEAAKKKLAESIPKPLR